MAVAVIIVPDCLSFFIFARRMKVFGKEESYSSNYFTMNWIEIGNEFTLV